MEPGARCKRTGARSGGTASMPCAYVSLLKWALPRLGLRWAGFRRVSGQVCKRIRRRCATLGLSGACAYRAYLESHPEEWRVLDGLCRVTISRFYRDRAVFDRLRELVLPARAGALRAAGASALRAWSVGCGSGEEPYTLRLAWHFDLAPRFPELALQVVATDVDPILLRRARRACYKHGVLRELPQRWVECAFVRAGAEYCLRAPLRAGVAFARGDVRCADPGGPFDLVLCRNLAFSYFDASWQQRVLARLLRCMAPGAILVIGRRESLPAHGGEIEPLDAALGIYARSDLRRGPGAGL